jgi:hypothetical protein
MQQKDWIQEMIQYEATPKSLRVPQEKGKFIEGLGVPSRTYYHELCKKENKKKIIEIWLSEAFNGGNEILQKLAEKARGGDMKAIELYIKFVLELAENLDIKSNGQTIFVVAEEIAKKNGINISTSSAETDSE